MARPDLACIREREQLVVERPEDVKRALRPVDREVGPGDVAYEQAVAAEHRPRLVAPLGGDERERRVLGAVPRRVERPHPEPAQLELPPVVERLVVVIRRGLTVHVDGRAGGRREPAVPGHVVRVVGGLEDVLDVDTEEAREPQVLVDVEPRVDDRGDSGVLITDEVAGTAEVFVDQLTEDHPSTLWRRGGGSPGAPLGGALPPRPGRPGGGPAAAAPGPGEGG